ncbi:penicillin acylase family protein [Conexibacter sp. DBS9H8]|uniref:penicillin acylase family protein n=1 Tax=Conexibacter sp. DBS9H8 TaxID=2937801 RepID=UPI00200FB079|nr:penicillin acylase family protein [Conexibacter sp. DBS9H8]
MRWRAFPWVVVLACVLVMAGRSSARAAGFPIYSGFHSVLAFGEGVGTTPAALAAFEANGTAPAADLNEVGLYEGIEQAWPGFTAADLNTYYRNSDFVPEPSQSVLSGGLGGLSGDLSGNPPAVESPEPGATVVRQAPYGVPVIYGQTRAEAMYAAGYVTAQDRLFLMDVLRHTAEGTTAELLGAGAVPNDSAALGVQDATSQQLTAEMESLPRTEGAQGAQALDDIEQYVAGINAYINETKLDPALLPAEYAALGITPQPWTLADSAAVGIYLIGQDLVLSDNQAQQSEALTLARRRFGVRAGDRVYHDLRQAANPGGVVTLARSFDGQRLGRTNPASEAMIDPGSLALRDAQTGLPVRSANSMTALARERRALARLPGWAQALIEHPLHIAQGESNAVLVDAKASRTGQAMMVGGPQVDYYTPEVFLEYEMHAPGIDVSGIAFPGAAPYPLIGHGIDYAWTGTSAYSSNQDMFAERLCNPDGSAPSYASTHYVYKGRCVPFTLGTVTETTPVAPTSPAAPQTIVLHTENSVHGPITYFATVHGRPVALATANATRGHEVQSYIAFMRLAENVVTSPQSFAATMRYVTGGENWWYVDDKNIALLQSGWYPVRAAHTNPDFPIWGTGRWDWKGFRPATNGYDRLPARDNPTAIDPRDGYLVNWNNQIAHGWPIAAGYWTQGPVVRDTILLDDLKATLRSGPTDLAKLTGMVTAPAATADLRGVGDWPLLARVIGRPKNPTLRELVGLLAAWSRAGSQRRSLTYRGNVQYGPAVLLMDTWWPLLVRGEFGPVLGTPLLNFINANLEQIAPNGLYDGTSDAFGQGWENDVAEDLAGVLRLHRPDRFSRRYCGRGSLARCRGMLDATLLRAYRQLAAKDGPDPANWVMPTVCPITHPATCTQVVPTSVGAVSIPPQPFDNRGTFYQAVAIVGHRP